MKTDKVISQIRAASRAIVRQLGLLNNRFSSIGSISFCHALVEIDTYRTLTLAQLSMILNLEKSTVSRLVMQMVDEGMCQIQSDEKDRRNKLLSLTEKGLLFVGQIHQEAQAQVAQALKMMSEEEKNTVASGLSLYANALKESDSSVERKIRKSPKKNMRQVVP
jgi:DNA-binding MarR family transcriptional regulator